MKPEDYILQSDVRREMREVELIRAGYNGTYIAEKLREEFGE